MGVFVFLVGTVVFLAYCAYTGRGTRLIYVVTGMILVPVGIFSALNVGAAAAMVFGLNPFLAAGLFLVVLMGTLLWVSRAFRKTRQTEKSALCDMSPREEKAEEVEAVPNEGTTKLFSAVAREQRELTKGQGS